MKNNAITAPQTQTIYHEITTAIINKMLARQEGGKQGKLIWQRGYNHLIARNWTTKTSYTGINYLLLNFVYAHPSCPYYATFKQISKIGGKVKKGAKGIKVIFYKNLYKQNGKYVSENAVKSMTQSQREQLTKFYTVKYYYVYNMMDTEGVKNFEYEKWSTSPSLETLPDSNILESYKSILKLYNDRPEITLCNTTNAYLPLQDKIQHIRLVGWTSITEFVCTMFHELIHSTGHPNRLNRFELTNFPKFGSKNYAEEELIAELGAAMLCNHIGIFPETMENSTAYLQGWIKVLENDEKLIFKASAKAQKAVDYMLKE